jgi:hypothetical protein
MCDRYRLAALRCRNQLRNRHFKDQGIESWIVSATRVRNHPINVILVWPPLVTWSFGAPLGIRTRNLRIKSPRQGSPWSPSRTPLK